MKKRKNLFFKGFTEPRNAFGKNIGGVKAAFY